MRNKMNKFLLLLALTLVVFCGCNREISPIIYRNIDGKEAKIDTEKQTITVGDHLYSYDVTGSGNMMKTVITYPDGTSWYWTTQGNSGSGGYSGDYEEMEKKGYIDGHSLDDALDNLYEKKEKSGNPLLGIVLLILGAINFFAPKFSWYLEIGWKIKDSEPSDEAIGWIKILGAIMGIIGIILIII